MEALPAALVAPEEHMGFAARCQRHLQVHSGGVVLVSYDAGNKVGPLLGRCALLVVGLGGGVVVEDCDRAVRGGAGEELGNLATSVASGDRDVGKYGPHAAADEVHVPIIFGQVPKPQKGRVRCRDSLVGTPRRVDRLVGDVGPETGACGEVCVRGSTT